MNALGNSTLGKNVSENEHKLDDFFNNATMGLHWVGPDGIIKRVNQHELDTLGYERDEYEGRHIAEFHVDEEVINDILQKLSSGEELYDYEARMRCKDGSIKHVLINSSTYQENGQFIHTRCFTRDITEQKRIECELRKKEDRLSQKVEDMERLYTLNMELLNQTGMESTVNKVVKASAQLMDADKASLQTYDESKGVLRLVDALNFDHSFKHKFGEVKTDSYTTCAAALRRGENVLLEDLSKASGFDQFIREAEPYGIQAVLSTPLFGEERRFLGVFTMFWNHPHSPEEEKLHMLDLYTQQAARQIERQESEMALKELNNTLEERVKERTSELITYQNQLRYLAYELVQTEEKERKRLAAELHDNLGQLLALGKMKVKLLLNKSSAGEGFVELEKLRELIDDALLYSRKLMSDLKPPPSLEDKDVLTSIRWVADKMEKHNLIVKVEDDQRRKPLSEEVQTTLMQCVRELLHNVAKHTDEKEAKVEIHRKGNSISVTVEDKGPGFDPHSKKFSPDRKCGFGLFSIRERVEVLGGKMNLSSEPGHGTAVELELPLEKQGKMPPEG